MTSIPSDLPSLARFVTGVEVGRLEGAVGLGELEEKAAEALGLAELSGRVRFNVWLEGACCVSPT